MENSIFLLSLVIFYSFVLRVFCLANVFERSMDITKKFIPDEFDDFLEGYDSSQMQRRNLRSSKAINDNSKLVSSSLSMRRPSFQKCSDTGEAYAAAYLITKEHLLYQHTGYNLTWVNCEMGSFIMMKGNANPMKNVNGSALQTVDVLDFSVIHLSTYERLILRWHKVSSEVAKDKNNMTPIFTSSEILRKRTEILHQPSIPTEHDSFNKTVVIMPFLGSDMGAGHSKLANRQAYLSACFWSFYAHYPHVVAAVKSPKDKNYILNVSGLPFYDVMLLENLPKSASLPVATVKEAKRRLETGFWSFEYIFFTESDQILMMRKPEDLYAYLDIFPRHVVTPHRLMAYPASVVSGYHKRNISEAEPYDWMDMQCCLPRQHCQERKEWQRVNNVSVPILQIYGIQVPLGNSNFHAETYRYCQLRDSTNQQICA